MDQIKEWIINDISFTSSDTEAADIAKFLVKGRLRPIWKFVAERIKLKKEADLIRKNLILHEERTKNHSTDVEADDYEVSITTKSLNKARKNVAYLKHEVQRLQTIVYEMNCSKDQLKAELLKSNSERSQIIEHQEVIRQNLNYNKSKCSELSDILLTIKADKAMKIENHANDVKLGLLGLLENNKLFQMDENIFSGKQPVDLMHEVLSMTRSLDVKVQGEVDKYIQSPYKGNIEKVLEDELYSLHVGSYEKFLKSAKQTSLIEAEKKRLVFENVPDESIRRLIILRETIKAGRAILHYLKANSIGKTPKQCTDLGEKFATVEQQSKKILRSKLLAEELLCQTANQRERVQTFVEQTREQKGTLYIQIHSNLEFKNIGLYSWQILQSLSLNKLSDQRLSKLPKLAMKSFKPGIAYLLSAVKGQLMVLDLKKIYSSDMENFESFGNVKGVLQQLDENFSKERETITSFIRKKLKSEAKSIDPCHKLLKAIDIWSQEPAKNAYSKALQPNRKGKALEEWYNYIRE